jgi:hypothetical protein
MCSVLPVPTGLGDRPQTEFEEAIYVPMKSQHIVKRAPTVQTEHRVCPSFFKKL